MSEPIQHFYSDGMKTVEYRGGLVRFQLPVEWIATEDGDGRGMYYLEGADTGTLRISVTTGTCPPGERVTNGTPEELLSDFAAQHGSVIERLHGGIAIATMDQEDKERGQQIRLRFWQIAQALPPEHLRMVTFSYTLLKDMWDEPGSQSELAMLDRQIRACELYPEVGELPRKPWWRFW